MTSTCQALASTCQALARTYQALASTCQALSILFDQVVSMQCTMQPGKYISLIIMYKVH